MFHRQGDGVRALAVEGILALLVEGDGASPGLVVQDIVDGRFLVHSHRVLPEILLLFRHHPFDIFLVEFRPHLLHVGLVDVEDDMGHVCPYLVVFLFFLFGEVVVFFCRQRLFFCPLAVDIQGRVEHDNLCLFSFLHVYGFVPFFLGNSSTLIHQVCVHLLELVERGIDGHRMVLRHGRHHQVEGVSARVVSSADILRESVPGAFRACPSHFPVRSLDDFCVCHEFVEHGGPCVCFLFGVLCFVLFVVGVVFLGHSGVL